MKLRFDRTMLSDPNGRRYDLELTRIGREMEAIRYLMELHIGRNCARCRLVEELKREATRLLDEQIQTRNKQRDHRASAAVFLAHQRRALNPGAGGNDAP